MVLRVDPGSIALRSRVGPVQIGRTLGGTRAYAKSLAQTKPAAFGASGGAVATLRKGARLIVERRVVAEYSIC